MPLAPFHPTAAPTLGSNAKLKSVDGLVPSTGSLNEAMAWSTTAYTMSLPNRVASLRFSLKFQQATATATVQGSALAVDTASSPIALVEGGVTTVLVVVTAQDTTTQKTCSVGVARAPSSDATLSSLSSSAGGLGVAFSPATDIYNISVAPSTAMCSDFDMGPGQERPTRVRTHKRPDTTETGVATSLVE